MMLKRYAICLSLTLFLFIQVFKAQVTITIPANNIHTTGLTNSEWRKPLGTFFGYERSAFIYQHSEIGQYGSINSISFYCDTVNAPGACPITIYMKEVPSYSFAITSTLAQEETGAQLVYSGTLTPAAFVKGQWTTITFTNPFSHATANSVEVIVETNAGGAGNEGSLGKGVYHYLTSAYAMQNWSADNTPPSGLGALSFKRPNVQFDMTPFTACSGQPVGGTTLSSVDTTCSAVSLFLQGSTAATGLSYQWEDSSSVASWTAIAGATSQVLNTSIGVDTKFRCKLICGTSAASYSVAKQVIKQSYLQCYCNTGLGGGCTGSAIDSVAIPGTSLVTSHTGCSANNYTLYPAAGNTCAQLASGQNYNLHTRFDGIVDASVWIDYDQSGTFDSIEWKSIIAIAKVDSDYVTALSVPVTAKTGLTKMRIRTRASGNLNDGNDACTNFGSGETEDYYVGINYDVSVEGSGLMDRFMIFPNPTKNRVYLTGQFAEHESIVVTISSIDGKLLLKDAQDYVNNLVSVDLYKLPPGAYFFSVQCKGFIAVKKLIISQ